MSFPVHEYPLLIVERHLDTFGHVNNATYLEIFEEARWDWISRAGFGLDRIRETGHGPTVLECSVKFREELRNRTPVRVVSQMTSYVRKIGRLRQTLVTGSGAIACEAEFVIGLFDTATRKLIEPTLPWLACLGLSLEEWQGQSSTPMGTR